MLTSTPPALARWSALVLAPWLALAGAEALVQPQERRKFGIAGVVGRWSEETNGGESAVLGDGSSRHVRPAADVEQIATSLFGRFDPAFGANAAAPGAFSLAVLQEVPHFAEGTYRARFKLVSGASDQTAGLVFNLRQNGEYLFVRYNTREGNVALWRYAAGQREVVARGGEKMQLPLGEWHELAVTIAGTSLVGAVNDTLRLEHDLKQAVAGRIGFWTKRDSVTMFKDIRVHPAR